MQHGGNPAASWKKIRTTQLSKLPSIIQQAELLELIPDQVQEVNNVAEAKLLYSSLNASASQFPLFHQANVWVIFVFHLFSFYCKTWIKSFFFICDSSRNIFHQHVWETSCRFFADVKHLCLVNNQSSGHWPGGGAVRKRRTISIFLGEPLCRRSLPVCETTLVSLDSAQGLRSKVRAW